MDTKCFGRNDIEIYETIGSTNNRARELALKGAPEGTLVISDSQSAGRGRFGRSWHSPQGKGLYLSMVLRPPLPPDRLPVLTLITGLGAAEALGRLCRSPFTVKWPNDLLHHDRKIAGILLESDHIGRADQFTILGFGININIAREELPAEVRERAASLYMATGQKWDRVEVLVKILQGIEGCYFVLLEDGIHGLLDRYRRICRTLDSEVAFQYDGDLVRGRAVDVDDSGRLMVQKSSDGRVLKIDSGEVTLLKSPPPIDCQNG